MLTCRKTVHHIIAHSRAVMSIIGIVVEVRYYFLIPAEEIYLHIVESKQPLRNVPKLSDNDIHILRSLGIIPVENTVGRVKYRELSIRMLLNKRNNISIQIFLNTRNIFFERCRILYLLSRSIIQPHIGKIIMLRLPPHRVYHIPVRGITPVHQGL